MAVRKLLQHLIRLKLLEITDADGNEAAEAAANRGRSDPEPPARGEKDDREMCIRVPFQTHTPAAGR